MSGSPETLAILDKLKATRTSARERQDEVQRRLREEARHLKAAASGVPHKFPFPMI